MRTQTRYKTTFKIILALSAWLSAIAGARADSPEWRVEQLAVVTTTGSHVFEAEIADTPALRRQGLMHREELAENRGMLFDFGSTGPVTMWMKNTPLSLDMIFIRADGSVGRIEKATEPYSERVIHSGGDVRFVLEVRAGTADRIGLARGDLVVHPLMRPR